MRVFIIEDEDLSTERLERQLRDCSPEITIAGKAHSVSSAVSWLKINAEPDLVLTDIELGDGQCFRIFREVDVSAPVIFITSFDESSMRVFREKGIDYLLKPVKRDDLQKCLAPHLNRQKYNGISGPDVESLISELRAQHKQVQARQRLLVRNGHGLKAIETEDIAYLFADGKYTYLKTWKKETFAITHALDDLERMLDSRQFYRLTRNFLVHRQSIAGLHAVSNFYRVNLQPAHDKEIIINKDAAPAFLRHRH